MHQEDINKDLGHYIHDRKDKPFWTKLAPKPHNEEVKEAIKEDIESKAEVEESKIEPEDKKELNEMEEEIADAHEEEEQVEERQEGVLKRFFRKLNFSDKKEKDDESNLEEEVEESSEDEEMREFLKKMHRWITQLPPDTQKEFKNSEDFELYTKMLKKYDLIK